MKKIITFTLSLLVFSLNAQDIFKSRSSETGLRYWVLCPDSDKNPPDLMVIPIKKTNSGLSLRRASNSQLAAIGFSALGIVALNKASKDKAASYYDKTIDPADHFFLAGVCFLTATGLEISYVHHFRQASKKLALEQEMTKLEREKMERRIQELEERINR